MNGLSLFAHIIVLECVESKLKPEGMVVHHRDGNRKDFSYENLQVVSTTFNARSRKMFVTNTSGKTGVLYQKERCKWVGAIYDNEHKKKLQSFDTKEDAIAWRMSMEAELGEGYGTMLI